VVIADDHPLVRSSLRRALEETGIVVVGEAADGLHAMRLAERHRPTVVVMDMCMPDGSGLLATKRIMRLCPSTAVLILTMLSDAAAMQAAKDAGASGFVSKDSDLSEIVDAVRDLASQAVEGIPAAQGHGDPDRYEAHSTGPGEARPRRAGAAAISRREEEILRLLATGVSTREAARTLCISAKTLKNHLAAIYRKLDVHDRSQAVLRAARTGIIDFT
jgi:DNA-binding NarL/FixJ family response regulator